MTVVLLSGALSGLLLFVVRHFTVVPLIETAETYEAAAVRAHGMSHDDEGWQPADGLERTLYTALSTILASIGFAAVLFGAASLSGQKIDARRGTLWGLAGFLCFALAPALGLPPKPPGAAVADLYARQLWWIGAVIATSAGLWLVFGGGRHWLIRIGGVALAFVPHVIGAPMSAEPNVVPEQIMRQFVIASLGTSALFWAVLGALGGLLYSSIVDLAQSK
jgi:cobalt transporter subunit CbtA